MVKLVVCVKHVAPEGKVGVSRRTGKPVYEVEIGVMNALGKKALGVALHLASQSPGSEVVALSVGPPEAESTMREALAMGANRAILLADPLIVESDGLGVAKSLVAAVERIGGVDAVITGARTSDRYAGQVGPAMAALLGWGLATHGRRVDLDGRGLVFEKVLTDGRVVELVTPLPCLISIGDAAARARHATSWGVHAAFTTGEVELWSLDQLGVGRDQVGPAAALTVVQKVETVAEKQRATEIFEGAPREVAESLVRRLASRGLLQ